MTITKTTSGKIRHLLSKAIAYLNSGTERSIRAKRNIFYSFFLKGMSILSSLLLVPLTINFVNPTRYGIWLTLSSVIGWLTFFDIGFGNGFRNKFAEALAKQQFKLARIYLSTTYAVLGMIMAAILLVFLFVHPFLDWSQILNTSPAMRDELSQLALIVFIFFCFQFVLQLITTVLTARQQPARAALLNLFGNLGSLAIIFLLTKITSGSLILLGLSYSLMPLLVLSIATFFLYRGSYRQFAPSWRYVRFGFARPLMGLGLRFFVIQLSALILFQTNNIVISQLLGPEQVAPYNIAFKYFGILQMLFLIVISPFWSAYTDAYYRKDMQWIRNTTRKLIKFWFYLVGVLLMMTLCSGWFYELWVGSKIKVSLSLSIACAVYTLIITWSSIFVNFVNGVGKIQLQLYYSILIAFINFPLSIFFIKYLNFGVEGLVYANCICLFIGAFLGTVQYRKISLKKDKGIWSK